MINTHKLGNIRKIDGKRFKAVHWSSTVTNAKTKAQYLRDHDPKGRGVRVIKHGNEYYIYREVK